MYANYIKVKERDSKIARFISSYKISTLLSNCGCKKEKGVSVCELITYLIKLVFIGRNFYRDIETGNAPFEKDVVYRFLNYAGTNWPKLLVRVAKKAYDFVRPLTSESRVDCLVLDDTLFDKSRSKKVELLSKVFDHVSKKYCKGFRALTLGWTDGNTFLPLMFSLMSSQNKENILCEENTKLDKRTNAYKIRQRSKKNTLDVAVDFVKEALKSGFSAKYLLCDSWFSFASFIDRIVELKLNVIAMLKDTPNQLYAYKGKKTRLSDLYAKVKGRKVRVKGKNVYFSTITVQMVVSKTKTLPMKITFIKAVGKKREWVAIGSTDTALSEEEITRIYGKRWSIEVFFKTAKSDLAFAKEFQGRSFDMLNAHTTIVYLRYIMLALDCRSGVDNRTMGELFYIVIDELADIKLDESVKILLESMLSAVSDSFNPSDESMRDFCTAFLGSLPANLREKFVVSDCES